MPAMERNKFVKRKACNLRSNIVASDKYDGNGKIGKTNVYASSVRYICYRKHIPTSDGKWSKEDEDEVDSQ
jgi:hypothetical protein